MILNIAYDQSVSAAPAGFKAAIDQVGSYLQTMFTDSVTIRINIGWGQVSGLTLATGALGESWTAKTDAYSYRDVRAALAADSDMSAVDKVALASLPTTDPTNGGAFDLPRATAKVLGLLADDGAFDGYIAFNGTPATFTFDPNARSSVGRYDFFAVALHEFSHVMGRTLGLGAPGFTLLDLFRYEGRGDRALNGQEPAYFSVDGGETNLGDFSLQSIASPADWAASVGDDLFRAALSANRAYELTAADWTVMDALGWTLANPPSFVQDVGYIVLADTRLSTIVSGAAVGHVTLSEATLTGGAAHGAVELAADGVLSYTPAAGFAGVDRFTYHALVDGTRPVVSQALVHVVPVLSGSSDTLDFLALGADEQIAAIYATFFGRAADAGGFDFWVGEFDRGHATQGSARLLANIASSFGVSAEAKSLYPFLAHPFGTNDAEIGMFLDAVYGNLFNRTSDPGGRAYWTGQVKQTLAAGEFIGSILVDILSGTKNTAQSLDVTTLMGKVIVGLHYVERQQAHGATWTADDIARAADLLDGVTSTPQSVLMGIRNADAAIAAHDIA